MISTVPANRAIIHAFRSGMGARSRFVCGVTAIAVISGPILAAQASDRRELERLEQALRREGQAVVALADAPPGRPQPADFALTWHNDFLKAQTGTFVPFIVTIAPRRLRASDALLYVRAARPTNPSSADARQGGRRRPAGESAALYPFEEIYPVALSDQPVRIARGFALQRAMQITVVVRERERDDQRGRRRLAAVLRQPLSVPDYATGTLATSTVMLASRLTVLSEPPRRDPRRTAVRDWDQGNRAGV